MRMYELRMEPGLDLVKTVHGYEEMRLCLYALQIALYRTTPDSLAYGVAQGAVFALQEVVAAMPDTTVDEWARLSRLSRDKMKEVADAGRR